ncbi:transposase [Micromonospora sp. NBC_01412]|uniref:transposase n=1 Tax=Micromonospora sp. NBC_01412 TaxID=2903590 RepID=UPI00386FC2D8
MAELRLDVVRERGQPQYEHLGYEKHDPAGVGSGNIRNGTRAKTVLTDASGPVRIDAPRDRVGTCSPAQPRF